MVKYTTQSADTGGTDLEFGPVRLEEFRGICERKTLFRMKKEADQVGFKGTRMGPLNDFLQSCR